MQKVRKILRAVFEKTALPTNEPTNYYQQHRSYDAGRINQITIPCTNISTISWAYTTIWLQLYTFHSEKRPCQSQINNNFSQLPQKLYEVYTATVTIPVLVPAGHHSNKILIRYKKNLL